MDTKTTYFFIGLVVLIVVLIFFARAASDGGGSRTTMYDEFAQCLGDAGAQFYGAYWCPHCQRQKSMFENSTELPYIECSTPDGQGQTQQCTEEGITGYPTWRFADGSEIGGVVELDRLAEKTGCELPQS